MSEVKQLRYVDHRPISMNLRLYGGQFIKLPNEKMQNIIKVTDAEYQHLIKRTNGVKQCFEPVDAPAVRVRRSQGQEPRE